MMWQLIWHNVITAVLNATFQFLVIYSLLAIFFKNGHLFKYPILF